MQSHITSKKITPAKSAGVIFYGTWNLFFVTAEKWPQPLPRVEYVRVVVRVRKILFETKSTQYS